MSDVEIHEQRAERGRKIIEQVRELEAADKARYDAFAATIMSPNKKHVHRRDPAAAMVSAAISAPYSGELLRRSNCPFVVISRIAYYAEDDLRDLSRIHSRQRHPTPRHARQAPPPRRLKPETADGARQRFQGLFSGGAWETQPENSS